MNIPDLKFSHFTSENQYKWLKKRFLSQDYKSDPLEDLGTLINSSIGRPVSKKDLPENPKIEQRDKDSGKIITKDFYADFLEPSILNMASAYYLDFQKGLDEKALYDENSISGFAKKTIADLNTELDGLDRVHYLNNKIHNRLKDQANQLFDLIDKYIHDPYPEVKEKIQFKCNNTDVIYFFHLLRKKKIIGDISESDLGRIIDNVCMCYDSTVGGFKEISSSRKHLNKFWNEERSGKSANERLKQIFINEGFFNE